MSKYLASKLGELWRVWVMGRTLVGKDVHHNKYYMWNFVDRGQVTVRREVQMLSPPALPSDYDPSAIPIEWRSWLNGNRRVPPSEEEIQKLHEYREKVKERAKAVEAEEEKQKLRGQVLGKKVDGPDVNAFLRQLGPDSKAAKNSEGS